MSAVDSRRPGHDRVVVDWAEVLMPDIEHVYIPLYDAEGVYKGTALELHDVMNVEDVMRVRQIKRKLGNNNGKRWMTDEDKGDQGGKRQIRPYRTSQRKTSHDQDSLLAQLDEQIALIEQHEYEQWEQYRDSQHYDWLEHKAEQAAEESAVLFTDAYCSTLEYNSAQGWVRTRDNGRRTIIA